MGQLRDVNDFRFQNQWNDELTTTVIVKIESWKKNDQTLQTNKFLVSTVQIWWQWCSYSFSYLFKTITFMSLFNSSRCCVRVCYVFSITCVNWIIWRRRLMYFSRVKQICRIPNLFECTFYFVIFSTFFILLIPLFSCFRNSSSYFKLIKVKLDY